MRGEVYRLAARGSRHNQRVVRYAVVLQSECHALSTWIGRFTRTSAARDQLLPGGCHFRPADTGDMDRLAPVDVRRLGESANMPTLDEMQRIDDALTLILDL